MLEKEVLDGTALLLLELPEPLRSVEALRAIFAQQFAGTPAAQLVTVAFNTKASATCPAASESTNNDDVSKVTARKSAEEVGAVQFASAAAVQHILLECITVTVVGSAYDLELRRGTLQLGPHTLLVEGVVSAEAKASYDASSKDEKSSPTADPTAPPHSSPPSASPGRAPTTDPSDASNESKLSVKLPVPPPTESLMPKAPGGGPKSVVLIFSFFLLYCRQASGQQQPPPPPAGPGRSSGSLKDFKMTAYVVYQILRPHCAVSRAVIVKEPSDMRRVPRTRVLAQFPSEELAQEAAKLFNESIVELHCPSPAFKRHQREPATFVEARYRVSVCYSQKPKRYNPAADENDDVHRDLSLTPSSNMSNVIVFTPEVDKAASRIFENKWLMNRADGPLAAAPPARVNRSPPRATPMQAAVKPKEFDREHHCSSESHGRRRGRSRSRSCSPPVRRHAPPQQRPRIEEPQPVMRRPEPVAAAPAHIVRHAFIQPPTSATTSHYAPSAPTHASQSHTHHSQLPQPQHFNHSATATPAAVPPPPPVESDHLGPLPPGWRPIYSEEYKQTYYAYRDPVTGADSTTWSRPQGVRH